LKDELKNIIKKRRNGNRKIIKIKKKRRSVGRGKKNRRKGHSGQ